MTFAGSFLVARPVLRDPNFARSVVLLLAHGTEGAFGLVVNRPVTTEDFSFPIYAGGPCPSPGLLMLHGHPDWVKGKTLPAEQEPVAGIYLGDGDSLQLAMESAEEGLRFRVFRGYAGWGPGQLEGELASGGWALVPATAPLLFDTPHEDLWEQLVPPFIPQPSIN